MIIKMLKWGNSIGFRIPMIIVKEMNLKAGDPISITLHNNKIIIEAQKRWNYDLKDLLSGINEMNCHHEQFDNQAIGDEEW